MRARIAEERGPARRRARSSRPTLAEHVADPDERAWIGPRLAHLLGLEEPRRRRPAGSVRRLAAVLRAARRARARSCWCSRTCSGRTRRCSTSSSTCSSGRARSRSSCSRSPGPSSPSAARLGRRSRNATSLPLEPLDASAMSELLDGFVPGLPDELRTQILERAEGMPLYAVETVRMLLDRGLLAQDGAATAPTGDDRRRSRSRRRCTRSSRPASTGSARRSGGCVQDAAVLGKTFTHGRSPRSPAAEAELEPRSPSLVRKEVLSVAGRSALARARPVRLPAGPAARSPTRRCAAPTATRHLAAARHLESVLDAEAAEVVAAHHLDAYRADPNAADADEIRARAAAALERGGRRAASLGAREEAGTGPRCRRRSWSTIPTSRPSC